MAVRWTFDDKKKLMTIIGEGGSGGAIALAAADRVIMLEHAIYSVISPEGCAAILWRSSDKAKEAAEALKLTAQESADLVAFLQTLNMDRAPPWRGKEYAHPPCLLGAKSAADAHYAP